ncbi:hypothetical protein BP5796_07300 [Coleophoma crateriformis]|uniref:RING-14 protein n=1 Tax=Coleophoma crateriformis TaxID=565419 RepID=A0A3D8RIV2_9HELO|nr:hypothetical protein BP5796_07300 [Coleophoma crateriformis]
MKFAHEFKEALAREGFPPHWLESAVPYGQLKKCIKKVESELRSIGLDSCTLAQLMPNEGQLSAPTPLSAETAHSQPPSNGASSIAFQYDFDGTKSVFRPKLVLFIRSEDGLAVDAELSSATRQFLEALVSKQNEKASLPGVDKVSNYGSKSPEEGGNKPIDKTRTETNPSPTTPTTIQRVEVPLTFDAEFFGLLQNDVTSFDSLQVKEHKVMTDAILDLSTKISCLTKPSKFGKSDLYRWRELFDIYVQAGIFFSTQELDHGRRTSTIALKQLQWFQNEVIRAGIVDSFKIPESRQALKCFVAINVALLRNLKFQEINQLAITKILKSRSCTTLLPIHRANQTFAEFDKRTRLGATKTFPKLIQSDSIMSESMAKAVCFQVSQDILKLVPQVDDYLCPICFSIAWRPIRLRCKHIFCIRCTIRMQTDKKLYCPLCRDKVIMEADQDNIDEDLASFLKKYFPKETRQKQIELETAAGIEQFGIYYKHPSESKCCVM